MDLDQILRRRVADAMINEGDDLFNGMIRYPRTQIRIEVDNSNPNAPLRLVMANADRPDSILWACNLSLQTAYSMGIDLINAANQMKG
jgi:hypothetical protein